MELRQRILHSHQRWLGEGHDETIDSQQRLANTYERRSMFGPAALLRLQVLDQLKQLHGEDHLKTVESKYMLAYIYAKQYRLQAAEELALEVLSARKQMFGEAHPKTEQAKEMLALIFYKKGHAERSRPSLSQPAKYKLDSVHSGEKQGTSTPIFINVFDRAELDAKNMALVSSALARIAHSPMPYNLIHGLTPVQNEKPAASDQNGLCEKEVREPYILHAICLRPVIQEGPNRTSNNSQPEVFYQRIGRNTSRQDGFEYLDRHHCPNLTDQLDPLSLSVAPVTGSYYNDIWQGRLVGRGDLVAIKCPRLHVKSSSSEKLVKRATREAYFGSLVAQTGHPNVIQLMGVALFQGQLALITPWMSNGTLHDYIRNNQDVDRWQMCQQVAEGLLLTGYNKVHGDLKATNVFISGDGVAKLGDFGSTLVPGELPDFTATSNVGGGTSRWMGRELLLCTGSDDNEVPAHRSMPGDVFALGMTILEVVTGRKPYSEHRSDPYVTTLVIKGVHPQRPPELSSWTRFGDERWTMLGECWHMKPEFRPSSRDVKDRIHALT
ncbi:hypothetical protein FRC12_019056 [Ceratobasidium sp. 428]|nr:hypothetical protein FRC12_019056 [Ceratobasidium sp. 428]